MKVEGPSLFEGMGWSPEPLAYRMRPRSLEEFVGQEHVLGPDKPLRRALEAGKLPSSLIIWGPPGTGKTSLALLVAEKAGGAFERMSAVLAGVGELRRVIEAARRRKAAGRRTILLIDEIHRWNKAQQDALLPHVEDGTIVMIGVTTENPFYEVIPPLVSRSRVIRFEPLSEEDILKLLKRALNDPERGYGRLRVEVPDEVLKLWAKAAGGDARNALNSLELAVESTPPDRDGVIRIDMETAKRCLGERIVRYDKAADEHYDTISAFIKSVRGSDPDAALYWLAKMIHAGEDPRFIMRRLLILAAEDIGLADPMAIVLTAACAQALEHVGLPEAQYHLAEATLYLATAPKSNSVGAYFKALEHIKNEGAKPVPSHLKTSSPDYKYPHAYPGHWVDQRYLPEGVEGGWFEPSDQGYERRIKEMLERIKRLRENVWNGGT